MVILGEVVMGYLLPFQLPRPCLIALQLSQGKNLEANAQEVSMLM